MRTVGRMGEWIVRVENLFVEVRKHPILTALPLDTLKGVV